MYSTIVSIFSAIAPDLYMISLSDFQQLELKIGTIESAKKVEGMDKLLKLTLDMGGQKKQLLAGIGNVYTTSELLGKQVPVLVNLKPKTIRGIESQGMMLAANAEGKPVLLHPDKSVLAGSIIR